VEALSGGGAAFFLVAEYAEVLGDLVHRVAFVPEADEGLFVVGEFFEVLLDALREEVVGLQQGGQGDGRLYELLLHEVFFQFVLAGLVFEHIEFDALGGGGEELSHTGEDVRVGLLDVFEQDSAGFLKNVFRFFCAALEFVGEGGFDGAVAGLVQLCPGRAFAAAQLLLPGCLAVLLKPLEVVLKRFGKVFGEAVSSRLLFLEGGSETSEKGFFPQCWVAAVLVQKAGQQGFSQALVLGRVVLHDGRGDVFSKKIGARTISSGAVGGGVTRCAKFFSRGPFLLSASP